MTFSPSIPTSPPAIPKPWERQEGEGSKAWRAFCIYRDLGEERTVSKVVDRLEGKTIGYMRVLQGWSSRWGWVARARAYDDHLEAQERKAWEDQRLKMTRRHATMAQVAQTKALQALNALPPGEIPPATIVSLMKMGVDMERLARGEPTEMVARREVVLPDTLDPEDAELMLERLRKKGQLPGMIPDAEV